MRRRIGAARWRPPIGAGHEVPLHPRSSELAEGLRRLASRANAWRGLFYRTSSPRWASSGDLVSGEGSRRFGGRWNPPGIRTVYGSSSPELSLSEALAATRTLGIPDERVLPRVTVAGHARLASVLRLDARVRRSLHLSRGELLEPDWRAGASELPSQALGRLAHALGFEGLLVPSAAGPGDNLVVFPDNLRARSRLEARGLVEESD